MLKNCSTAEFKKEVETANYKIVVYGYGVIGKITVPQILKKLGVEKQLLFFVDTDENKHGRFEDAFLGEIMVCSPEQMLQIKETFVILVSASRYGGIVDYLERSNLLRDINVYILPMMLEKESLWDESIEIRHLSTTPIIPKKIHYCWFGKHPLPVAMQKCINSWRKYCPDYEIIEWNESNYDVNKYRYMRQAYEREKWAFVSDVARLDILYENGGIYLDTDVELIRNLDDMLFQPGFCGVEKWRIINSGGGCGAVPKNYMIGKMLEHRKSYSFVREDGSLDLEPSGTYETLPFIQYGYKTDNSIQIINDMTIYPSEVFHPYDYMTRKCMVTKNTFSIHHFAESWV